MLFNSLEFALFLPVIVFGYFLLPYRLRPALLLCGSIFFYMSYIPSFVLILFFVICTDYFLAMGIERASDNNRKYFLIVSIVINIGILGFFKYFDFFSVNVGAIAHLLHWNYTPTLLRMAIPLGLSFHVFQSLSYVIEVYKGKFPAEKNFLHYALYVMFFPQLVAGPIERPGHLLPQFSRLHDFDPVLARRGLERMAIGFMKKLVVADQIAQIINPLYLHPPTDSLLLIVMALLFTFQIYADFSGYSDIAIGCALLMGFNITENFDRPFAARSIGEFWRRWHISLSSWLRDYLYYPLALGVGRVTKTKLHAASFTTFALIGLWHGANWTFVLFGAVHGVYLSLEMFTEKLRKGIIRKLNGSWMGSAFGALQVLLVFALVTLSFILFRAPSASAALWMLNHIISFSREGGFHWILAELTKNTGSVVFYVALGTVVLLEMVQFLQAYFKNIYFIENFPAPIRYAYYYVICTLVILFGYFGSQSFIYFQF